MILPIIVIIVIIAATFTYFSSNTINNEVAEPRAMETKKSTEANDESVNAEKVEETTSNQAVLNTNNDVTSSNNLVETKQTSSEITFVEGSHYITKFPNEQPDSPIIVEFFSYMCPHCYNFEPTVSRWIEQKPKSVSILRVPVTFGQSSWRLAAKSYYIAEELNMADAFSEVMFKKIHIEKKPPITEDDLGELFASLNVKPAVFTKAASSFTVDSKLRKADFLAKKYKVSGVPYFLINYKYEIGKASYESEEALFQLWNNLPAKDFK